MPKTRLQEEVKTRFKVTSERQRSETWSGLGFVKEYHQEKVNLQNGHNLGTVRAQEAQLALEDRPVIH